MKTIGLLIFILLFIPVLSHAGNIFGTIISENGIPLTNKVVQLTQNEKVFATCKTDAKGYFSFKIKGGGNFSLVVVGHFGARFNVFSSNNSKPYNLILRKTGDKWILISQSVVFSYPAG